MTALHLYVRTPAGLLVDRPVDAIVAEDLDGWFGIHPGRADLIAALPPGLLTFRDADGECFVANTGGLLDLRAGACRVMVADAQVERSLDELAPAVEATMIERRRRSDARRATFEDLEREVLRRMAKEVAYGG